MNERDASPTFGDGRDDLVERYKRTGQRFLVDGGDEYSSQELLLQVRNVLGHTNIRIDPDYVDLLSRLDMTAIVKLGDYEAIYNPNENKIEAAVRSGNRPSVFLGRRLQSLPGYEELELGGGLENGEASSESEGDRRHRMNGTLKLEGTSRNGMTISFAPASDAMAVLGMNTAAGRRGNRLPTLHIDNVDKGTEQSTQDILEEISAATFFEFDMVAGMPLSLARTSTIRISGEYRRRRREVRQTPLQAPQLTYSKDAISLYMQGRSATDMPLLQYLTYYQAIEHFFPYFTRAEALRKMRVRVQDPRFDPRDDTQMNNLFNLVQASAPSAMKEKEQLRAVFEAVVDVERLRQFIEESPSMKEKLDEKNFPAKGVHRIAVDRPGLLDSTAERVYDLRNRIVHAKSDRDPEKEAIYPQSAESRGLHRDIELIEFLACEVIISGAS